MDMGNFFNDIMLPFNKVEGDFVENENGNFLLEIPVDNDALANEAKVYVDGNELTVLYYYKRDNIVKTKSIKRTMPDGANENNVKVSLINGKLQILIEKKD